MCKFIDITGLRFGRLIVIERAYTDNDKFIVWKCVCDCGNICYNRAYPLKTGKIKSCGCLNNEMRSERSTTHGRSKDPIYDVWQSMKQRCFDINDKRYHRYGGRGIKICNEWLNPVNFINWAESNGYKKGLTLDRINNDGDYFPDNCRFVTVAKNNRNSSNTHLIETDIIKIRSLYTKGVIQIDIASMFKISQQTVSKIVNNKTWKNE